MTNAATSVTLCAVLGKSKSWAPVTGALPSSVIVFNRRDIEDETAGGWWAGGSGRWGGESTLRGELLLRLKRSWNGRSRGSGERLRGGEFGGLL